MEKENTADNIDWEVEERVRSDSAATGIGQGFYWRESLSKVLAALRWPVMDPGTSHKRSLQTRTATFSNQSRQLHTLSYTFSDILQYILLNENSLQAGPRGEREIQFYRTITEATDSNLKQFQPFIPSFYGSCTKKDGQFMMIENATMRMARPCIMDVKVCAATFVKINNYLLL